jgi:hypothetical protein
MTAAIAIQAELTEIEELLLSAAERSYPQPLTPRSAQNSSRRLKATSLSAIREGMLSLAKAIERVQIENQGEGNGAIALMWCPPPDCFEEDEDESELPEPEQIILEWKSWQLRRPIDKEELLGWERTSKPVQTSFGTLSVGDWVRVAQNLGKDSAIYQIVGIENATKIALVSIYGVENVLDRIPIDRLYFFSGTPQAGTRFPYPKPYDETFKILQAPPAKKPVITHQTKLETAKIELEKAQQKYELTEENFYAAKVNHDAFLNQSAPNQSELTVSEFLELRSKIESQTEGHKRLLARASEGLAEAKDELDDAVKLVEKLTREIERDSAITTAETEFQAAYQNYCDALQKLYDLQAFEFRQLGTYNRIPNFKDTKIQCDRLSEILGA